MKEAGARTPEIHWAWVILFICFLNLFVNYGIRLGYGVVLPEMIRTIHLTRTQGGDIFNSYLLVYVCLSPFAGHLTDRFGARRVISLFGIVLGVGTLLLGSATGFGQASLFFALVGMGAAAMWTPIMTLVQRWFAVERRGMALGILSTGFGLGFAVMGRLHPFIIAHWSWRHCWYLLGIAALTMVVVNAIFLRSKPEDKGLLPWGTRTPDPLEASAPQSAGGCMLPIQSKITRMPTFWLIGASYFLVAGALYVMTTFMVDYARYELDFSYSTASFLATVHGSGQIIGVLIIGFLSDHIGRRMTILLSNLFIAASIGGILLAGAEVSWLFASVAVMGAFYGATFPMYAAACGDYFAKERMGKVIGLFTLFYGSGAIAANRVAGHLRDVSGSFSTPFFLAMLAALAAAFLMYFVRRPER